MKFIFSPYCWNNIFVETKEKVFEISSLATGLGTWFILDHNWINILISIATFVVYFIVAMYKHKKIRLEKQKLTQETIRLEKENAGIEIDNKIKTEKLQRQMLLRLHDEAKLHKMWEDGGFFEDDIDEVGREIIKNDIDKFNESKKDNT